MKPKIYFFTTLFAILLPLFVTAQTNYRPGFYVNDQMDTVTGLIEYRSNAKMTHVIRYKKDAYSKPQELRPGNTRHVVIEGKVFMEGRSYVDVLTDESTDGFFQKVITGRLSLYRYGYDRYFVSKGDDRIYEITKFRKRNRDSGIQIKFQGFGFLKILTDDCPAYNESALMAQYTTTVNYRDIVTNYNNCFEANKQIVHEKLKLKMHVGVGIHGSLTAIQHDFSKNPDLSNAKMGTKIYGTGGIFFSIFHPDLGDNIRVIVEPGVGKYNGYAFFKSGLYADDLYLRYTYARAPVLARFIHNNVFFDFGWTNFLVLNQNNTWRYESQQGVDGPILTSDKEHKIKNSFIGLAAGVGGKFEIANRPVYTSLRFSNLFLSSANKFNQSSQKWFDLSIAFQLTK